MLLNKQSVVSFAASPATNESNDIEDPPNEYLFDLDVSCDARTISTSVSNNVISSYDVETLTLQSSVYHEGRINSFECSKLNPSYMFSASSDKTCCVWDKRITPKPAMKLVIANRALSISAGVDDMLLAVASEQSILFYDIRKGCQNSLGEYSDCHTDDVSMVKFSPTRRSILVSAGEDGLICIFDTSVATSDSAVTSILNTECPVRKFGFFGASNEGIICLSTVETASAWHFPSAQRVGSYPNIRTDVSADYLVDSWFDEVSDTVYILTGNFNGDGRICTVNPSGVTVMEDITGGHRDMLRCCSYNSPQRAIGPDILFTGGEDGRLCTWRSKAVDAKADESTSCGVLRSTSIVAGDELRYKPY